MTKQKRLVYVFRHGKTDYNTLRKFTGFHDSTLTEEGVSNAKKVAMILKDKSFAVAVQTRLSRSQDTLQYVLEYHKDVEVVVDDRMIERDYGELSGQLHQDIIDKHGQAQYDLWHRGFSVRPPGGGEFCRC